MTDATGNFGDKVRSLGVIGRRSGDRVREWRSDNGELHKATTDELNNTVTQHAIGDRQDVTIRPPHVVLRARTEEHR